jgi:predicted alpha/beta superfamily hydrolase
MKSTFSKKNLLLDARSSMMLSLLSVIFLIGIDTFAQEATTAFPPVQIPGTETRKITSSAGQEYTLLIHLPGDYTRSNKTYPVLYLLDAQWDFPLVTALYGQQYYDGFLPGMIIVGITWGGKDPNPNTLRARDFTPTTVQPQTGEAGKFLSFIKEELTPFIESSYHASQNDRTLMGSSLGGLFTLYAMFKEPSLFNRYVLTSPALGWDNKILFTYEKEYGAKTSELPVKLFMAIGEMETGGIRTFDKFITQVKAARFKGLELHTRVLEGIGHSGSKAEGYTRGLQAVFAKPSLSLNPSTLDQYTGTYELGNGSKLTILKKTDHLLLQVSSDTELPLRAETEKDFYLQGEFLNIRFQKDPSGKVTGFQLERYGSEETVRKVK